MGRGGSKASKSCWISLQSSRPTSSTFIHAVQDHAFPQTLDSPPELHFFFKAHISPALPLPLPSLPSSQFPQVSLQPWANTWLNYTPGIPYQLQWVSGFCRKQCFDSFKPFSLLTSQAVNLHPQQGSAVSGSGEKKGVFHSSLSTQLLCAFLCVSILHP